MSNSLPNFLVVGAAKCGTTTLYKYLDEHSDVFMSSPKEPKFFSYLSGKVQYNGPGDQGVKDNIIKEFDRYKQLFIGANKYSARGEASTDYLYYHSDVIPLIKKILGDPKIIILLRDPVERAFSAYTHLVKYKREEFDFKKALILENERIDDGYEFIWHYKQASLFSSAVKEYQDKFTNVKIILLNDLKNNPKNVLNEVCEFLNLNTKKFQKEKVSNQSGVPKNNLRSIIYNFLKGRTNLQRLLEIIMPNKYADKIRYYINMRLYFDNLEKPNMDSETKDYLIKYFKADILKTEKIINRDLSIWLK